MTQTSDIATEDFNHRLAAIEARNMRVELEKKWETSNTRRFSILLTTYFSMCLLLWTLGHSDPLLHAIVPTLGFFLSTLTLPVIREIWKRSNCPSKSLPIEEARVE